MIFILFITSCIFQACVLLFILSIISLISSLIFNLIRILIYRVTFGKVDMLLNREKIAYGLVKQNVIQANVEVINKDSEELISYDDFERWCEINNRKLDIKIKQSPKYPDEIFLQGRVKRRRR